MDAVPQTLLEVVRYFADLGRCHEYLKKIKWPDGKIVCPHCQSERVGEVKTRRLMQCKDCRKQIYAKQGTIFEDSPLGLDRWFVAVWSVANCKNGISSHELGRALGVTQKTAWFMTHRIREAMRCGSFEKMSGEIEADETFIGGEARNMHAKQREHRIKGRGAVGKAVVQGLLERGGKVKCRVAASTEASELQPEIRRNVEPESIVYTDAALGYRGLNDKFIHQTIDHSIKYAEGTIHTNGIENFWSLLKRTLKGTYVSVAVFHLLRYLDEQAFRFNQRFGNDAERFHAVMLAIVGRRLTYRLLTAQGDAGFMGIK